MISTPLWISLHGSDLCKLSSFEISFIPEVILSMKKRALIRCIGFFLCRGWAQHIVDRWRDAVSSGFSPSASEDFDLLPCDNFP